MPRVQDITTENVSKRKQLSEINLQLQVAAATLKSQSRKLPKYKVRCDVQQQPATHWS
jgi:hypothetical protein